MKTRVALLQMQGFSNDLKSSLNKGVEYCRKAMELDPDIILFPEMWSNGYAPYHDEVWETDYDPRNPCRKELVKSWQEQAVTQESEFVQTYVKLAKELEVAIAITYMEKWTGNPRNSVSLIDSRGEIVFTYAKVHTCDFSLEYHLTPGEEFFVSELNTKLGKLKVGSMICFDREFPESARILMLKGAELIIVPNSCEMNLIRTSAVRVRAYENMLGIALANYAGKGMGGSLACDPMPYDKQGNSRDSLMMQAGSAEGIYLAEFDMDAIREFRNRETQGNSFRKPGCYSTLVEREVADPFKRVTAKLR